MSKNKTKSNLQFAGIFVVLVLCLIALSLLLKVFFTFRESKFDGQHNFIVAFVDRNQTKLVAFSPQAKTISVLNINEGLSKDSLQEYLDVPIDGLVKTNKTNLQDADLPAILFDSALPFSESLDTMTQIDALRLSIFAKTVKAESVYDRDFSNDLNGAQKATLLSLTFTDPAIYQENLGVQIVNGTDVAGIGGRLALLISNIGGNPILVGTSDNLQPHSKIIYYQSKSYTLERLSSFLGFPVEQTNNRGIGDITIIIGEDKVNHLKF